MAAIAGKGGNFTYNSVSYLCKSWSMDIDDNVIDTSNMTGSGWRTYISGLRGASFSAETFFDTVLAQLAPGDSLTNVNLGLGSSLDITFNAIVRKIRPSTSVDGAAMLSIEGVANGVVNTTFS